MKAVLFDLDETLLDRSASLLSFLKWQAYVQLSDDLSDSIEHKEGFIARFVELDNNGALWKDKVYETLLSEFAIASYDVTELLEIYLQVFSQHCVARPYAQKALQHIKNQGLKTGLVSNGPTPFQERNFAALNCNDWMDTVVVSAAVGMRKPDSEIFLLACERLSVKAEDVVFVGDNPVADIQGANAVGMYSVFVPSIRYPRCDAADAVCPDFSSLTDIIRDIP